MQLDDNVLNELGFDCNHPDYVLKKWHKHNKEGNEWNITIETVFIPLSNIISYKVFAYNTNDNGVIIRRCDASYINTTEDLNKVLDFCEIKL